MNTIHCEPLEPRRLLSFGSPASDFGTAAGIANTGAWFGSEGAPKRTLLDHLGRIMVASDGGITRLTATGQRDTSYAALKGFEALSLNVTIALDAACDSSDRVVLLAQDPNGTVLLRFNDQGNLDKTFGRGGEAIVSSDTPFSFMGAELEIDGAGRFVIAGAIPNAGFKGYSTRVYRATSAGKLDGTFGEHGIVNLTLGTTDSLYTAVEDHVSRVAIKTDGSIVIIGGSQAYDPTLGDSYGDAQVVVAQLRASDGAIEDGFGTKGYARVTIGTGERLSGFAAAGTVLSTGSIAVVGTKANRAFVLEFSPVGALQQQYMNPRGFGHPSDVAELGDGRLVLAYENVAQLQTVSVMGTFGRVIGLVNETGESIFEPRYPGLQLTSSGTSVLVTGSIGLGGSGLVYKIDAGTPADEIYGHFPGSFSSIVEDAYTAVHLAYYAPSSGRLMYARRTPSGIWGTPRIIDTTSLQEGQLSIAVDHNQRPAIAYYDTEHADLKLAQFIGSKWHVGTLDSAGTTGQSPSLKFTLTNAPAISYYDRTHRRLKFVTYERRKWVFETIDTKEDAGRYNSLDIAPGSDVEAVAYATAGGAIRYAARAKPNNWSMTELGITGSGAQYVDLKSSLEKNCYAISFYDRGADALRLSTSTGATWTTRTIATGSSQGKRSFLNTPYVDTVIVLTYKRGNDCFVGFSVDWKLKRKPVEFVIQSAYGKFAAVDTGSALVVSAFDSVSHDLHIVDT